MEELDQTTLNNPVTDIVDSYYIAMVGYENEVLSKLRNKDRWLGFCFQAVASFMFYLKF